VVLVVIALLGAGVGLFVLQRAEGDLSTLAHRAWNQFTSDRGPAVASGSRFSDVGLNGRLTQWRVAAKSFAARPLLGLGAQNFEFHFIEHRTSALMVRHAHSQPMQVLADLGLPGAAAYGIFIMGTLLVGIRARFRARRSQNQAVIASALLALGSWAVHSSADWLWQVGGVTWPAILLLGGLLAAGARRRDDAVPATSLPAAAPSDIVPSDAGRSDTVRSGGALPWIVRVAVVGVALVLLASGSLYYLSLRYLAVAGRGGSSASSIGAAKAAARLDPFAPQPFMVMADDYARTARSAGLAGDTERALANLASAAGAWEEATGREPMAWSLQYSAGLAILEYRDATAAATAGQLSAPAETNSPEAAPFRQATRQELTAWARAHLEQARRLNPLDELVAEALARLGE
jgi:O-Antigen ligase